MGASVRSSRLRRTALVGLVLALGVGVAACEAAPPPGCPTAPPDPITSTIHQRVNADRGARGLGPLAWNARLACLAQEWSATMANGRGLGHRDLGATIRSPGFESYTSLGENVYVGPGSASGDSIHGAWMNSPPHQANIMGDFDSIGIGLATSGDGRLWATENFGRH